jgi:hypothetical protein
LFLPSWSYLGKCLLVIGCPASWLPELGRVMGRAYIGLTLVVDRLLKSAAESDAIGSNVMGGNLYRLGVFSEKKINQQNQ